MKTLMQAAFAAGAFCMAASVAMADPAVVYDAGGKFDKSFNEAAYNGIEKFKKETGTSYLEFEVQADAQREQAFLELLGAFDQEFAQIFVTSPRNLEGGPFVARLELSRQAKVQRLTRSGAPA